MINYIYDNKCPICEEAFAYKFLDTRRSYFKNKNRWSSILRFEDFSNMPFLDLDDSYLKYDLKG